MNIKTYILIIIFAANFKFAAIAQEYNYVVYPGDSIYLNVQGSTNDSIQWQTKESLRSNWIDIGPKVTNSFIYKVSKASSVYRLFRAKVFNNSDSCSAFTSTITIHIVENVSEIDLGDFYEGGRLFYKQLNFGLVVGNQSYGSIGWGCRDTLVVGADSSGIGYGKQNTLDILKGCSSQDAAAYLIDTLNYNGFTDWFLPSIDELGLIFNLQWYNKIKFLESLNSYWSSTEFDRFRACSYNGIIAGGLPPAINYPEKWKNFLICPVREVTSKHSNKIELTTVLLPQEKITDIQVDLIDSLPTHVIVNYFGQGKPTDQLQWDFGQGKLISGSGHGPLQVYYNYEGYNRIKVKNLESTCKSESFYSDIFKVKMFEEKHFHFPGVFNSELQCADYNNDNFLDILITGDDTTAIYTNTGQDSFIRLEITLPRIAEASGAWADFDNDNLIDFAISGIKRIDSSIIFQIYHNEGNGIFTLEKTNINGLYSGFVKWVDLNNDGQLELIISGIDANYQAQTKIIKRVDLKFVESKSDIENLKFSSASFGDYNNDGYLDLLVSGNNGSSRICKIYKNESGNLKEIQTELLGIENGSAEWADFNNDGYLDLTISGYKNDPIITYNGSGYSADFRLVACLDFHQNYFLDSFPLVLSYEKWNAYANSTMDWSDYDNDGDLDLLINGVPGFYWLASGTGGGVPTLVYRSGPRIFRNDGQLEFKSIDADLPALFSFGSPKDTQIPMWTVSPELQSSFIKFKDYNNDGKIDVIREGNLGSAIYKNLNYYENEVPNTPDFLKAITTCESAALNWQKSNDDHTPTQCITYEIYIGTQPGICDVFSKANKNQIRRNQFEVNNLKPGTYYWSVKAVDQAQSASAWAPEQSFTISGKPATPVVTLIGNSLHSSLQFGNQWHDLNGPIAGATAQEYTPISNGTYYSIVSESACSSDTSNRVQFIYTEIFTSDDNSKFKIVPNPANDNICIHSLFSLESINYQLLTASGKLLKEGQFIKTINLDINQYTCGVYFLRLGNNKETTVFKVIKQ